MSNSFLIYADGACSGNGRQDGEAADGGWGALVLDAEGAVNEHSGFWGSNATNNKMELVAVIEGIKQTPAGARVKVFTDSQYVVKTMKEGWKRNANGQFWDELDRVVAPRKVTFHWIKGHDGDDYQERADQLAKQEIRANRLR